MNENSISFTTRENEVIHTHGTEWGFIDGVSSHEISGKGKVIEDRYNKRKHYNNIMEGFISILKGLVNKIVKINKLYFRVTHSFVVDN